MVGPVNFPARQKVARLAIGSNWTFDWGRLATAIVDADAALVLSIQHTGAWFVLDFLTNGGGGGGVTELAGAMEATGLQHRTALHAHTGLNMMVTKVEALPVLSATGRAIVPVRDPMLAMLSRHARHPLLAHDHLVGSFVGLAEADLDVTYIRVDCPESDRRASLDAVVEAVGWDLGEQHMTTWAGDWPIVNGSETIPAKEWYRARQWDKLWPVLGPEITALLAARPVLVPFLKSLGYEELPWWTL